MNIMSFILNGKEETGDEETGDGLCGNIKPSPVSLDL